MSATYKQIQNWVKTKYGFVPKSCWIAHTKDINGLPVRMSANRQNPNERMVPCPETKLKAITAAFSHFGMLKNDR